MAVKFLALAAGGLRGGSWGAPKRAALAAVSFLALAAVNFLGPGGRDLAKAAGKFLALAAVDVLALAAVTFFWPWRLLFLLALAPRGLLFFWGAFAAVDFFKPCGR